MRKKSKKKAPKKKDRRLSFKIRAKVGKRTKPTLEDVELAIKKKLAANPTDVFRNTREVIITIEDEGGGSGDGDGDGY